jgi:hypothetical protein
MIVNVHIAKSGSIMQFASRRDLATVLNRENNPAEDRSVKAWIWHNPRTFDIPVATTEWRAIRVGSLRKSACEYVVAAEDEARSEADLPAKALADERATKWREREAAGAAA